MGCGQDLEAAICMYGENMEEDMDEEKQLAMYV